MPPPPALELPRGVRKQLSKGAVLQVSDLAEKLPAFRFFGRSTLGYMACAHTFISIYMR